MEIVGDVANFGSDVERELNRELRSVDVDVRKIADDLSKGIDKGVKQAGKNFDGLSTKAASTLGEVAAEASAAGDAIGEGVKQGTDRARESLGALGDEAEAAGESIGAGVKKGTDRARNELGRFVASGKESSTRFRLGFGNLSVELGGVGAAAGLALTTAFKTAAVAGAVNTASQLVVALAPAVGALGVLPAAFIAAKVAAGTFKLAMMGVADAVTAGVTGDTAAFNEALKAMPPAAQAAIREIVSLKSEIMAVRTVVQTNFFAPLVGQLRPLGELYLPMIRSQLGGVAAGFGEAAGQSASFLRLPSSVKSVNDALTDVRTAINNVSAGLPGLIRGFLPLNQVGASFLPGLTKGFADATQRFGAFMERARESGQLEQFISGGLEALKQLGSILGDVGSILKSFFQAASAGGGDLLGVIGQTVGAFATFLNTAEGMSALTSIFQVLGGVAGLFGQALQVVLPVLGSLVGVLAGALQPILPVISSLIQQLAPVIAQVGAALGAILGPAIGVVVQLLASLVPALMPIISAFTSSLLPVVTALAPVITQLGTTISQVLVAALLALAPVFAQLLPVVSELLVAVLVPMAPIIAQLGQAFLAMIPAIAPVLMLFTQLLVSGLKPIIIAIPVVAAAISFLVGWIVKLIAPLNAAIGWVANFLSKLLESRSVASVASAAFNAIRSVVSTVFSFVRSFIVGAWNAIRSATASVWGFIRSYITGQINAVKSVLRSIGAVINTVVGFFNRMRSQASSALASMRSAVSAAVSAVIGFFGRLASGAQSKISALIAQVRGIGGRIRGAVGNLASLLVGAGRNVIQGLINGIGQKLGALRSKAASAAATIRNLFPFSPAKEGPLSGKGSPEIAGRKIASMLATGMQRSIPELRQRAIELAETVGKPLSGQPGRKKSKQQIALEAMRDLKDKVNAVDKFFDKAAGGGTGTGGSTGGGTGGGGDGGGPTFVFSTGSITLNFYGMAPSDETAYSAGRAAGRGLASAFAARDVRTEVRTI